MLPIKCSSSDGRRVSCCVQMRNLLLSAFPRAMRLPDPFTPNLKVRMRASCHPRMHKLFKVHDGMWVLQLRITLAADVTPLTSVHAPHTQVDLLPEISHPPRFQPQPDALLERAPGLKCAFLKRQ
jgi:CCR4-Not complex component, Not1